MLGEKSRLNLTAQLQLSISWKSFSSFLRRIFLRISEGHARRLAYTSKGTDGRACASILAKALNPRNDTYTPRFLKFSPKSTLQFESETGRSPRYGGIRVMKVQNRKSNTLQEFALIFQTCWGHRTMSTNGKQLLRRRLRCKATI